MGFSGLDYGISDGSNGPKMNFGLKVEDVNQTQFTIKLRY